MWGKEGQKEDRWVEFRLESRFPPSMSAFWKIFLPEDPAMPGEVCPLGSVSRQILELPQGLLEVSAAGGCQLGPPQLPDPFHAFLKPHIRQVLSSFILPLQSK